MIQGQLQPLLLLAALLLAAGPAQAQDTKPAPAAIATNKPAEKPASEIPPKAPKKKPASQAADRTDLNPLIAAQAKARSKALKAEKAKAADVKRVDINSASKDELKTIPGVTDAFADRIIAGRPYLTKIHLVTHNVITAGLYDAIKKRIVAKQNLPRK